MQIHFKGTNYEITSAVTGLATKKIEALKKYLGKNAAGAYAYVDLGKETEAHQKGRIWYTDINLDSDGKRFYAKATEENLETALDKTVAELGRELRSASERKQSLVRKGGALLKNLMQGT